MSLLSCYVVYGYVLCSCCVIYDSIFILYIKISQLCRCFLLFNTNMMANAFFAFKQNKNITIYFFYKSMIAYAASILHYYQNLKNNYCFPFLNWYDDAIILHISTSQPTTVPLFSVKFHSYDEKYLLHIRTLRYVKNVSIFFCIKCDDKHNMLQ
jgi:hypothetical protein